MKQRVKNILGFKDMGNEAVYLGNSLIFSKKKLKNLIKLKKAFNKDLKDGIANCFLKQVSQLLFHQLLKLLCCIQCRHFCGLWVLALLWIL